MRIGFKSGLLWLIAGVAATDAGAVEAIAKKPAKVPVEVKEEANRAPAAEGDLRPKLPPPQSRPSVIRNTQDDTPVPESPLEDETRLTKNWGGPRKSLSALGIDLGLLYKGEFNRVMRGGRRQDSTYLSNFDFRLSIDAEKLMGWKGGSAFFYVLHNHGGHPNQAVGDIQGTSNIETTASETRLYEAWIQQIAFDDHASFLVGLHDLNSEFYVTETSGLFFNSSFGVGKELAQTGVNGPSIFPVTSPAFRVRVEPTKAFYFQAALFEATAGKPGHPRGTHVSLSGRDGVLAIAEMAYLRGVQNPGDERAKYGAGAWTYTRNFDHLTETATNGQGTVVPVQAPSHGVYLLADQALTDSFSVFARYGAASSATNTVTSCFSTGAVYEGLIPRRDKDRFGIALTRVKAGDEYRASQESAGESTDEYETTIEANYRAQVLKGIAVQPDIQYVMDPGFAPSLENAWVGAVRVELNF